MLRVMTLAALSKTQNIYTCDMTSTMSYCISVGEETFCAIIDTGVQVSLVTEYVSKLLKSKDDNLVLHDAGSKVLTGIDNSETALLGLVEVKLMLLNAPVKSAIPFAMIKTGDIPCCCILEANFLSINEFTIDFTLGIISNSVGEIVCPLNNQGCNDLIFRYNIAALYCSRTETHNSSDRK